MYSDRCSVCINLASAPSVDLDAAGAKTLGKNTSRETGAAVELANSLDRARVKSRRKKPVSPVYLCFITGRMRYFAESRRAYAHIRLRATHSAATLPQSAVPPRRKVPNGEAALLKKDQARGTRRITSRRGIYFMIAPAFKPQRARARNYSMHSKPRLRPPPGSSLYRPPTSISRRDSRYDFDPPYFDLVPSRRDEARPERAL